jgi:hypothetical protein
VLKSPVDFSLIRASTAEPCRSMQFYPIHRSPFVLCCRYQIQYTQRYDRRLFQNNARRLSCVSKSASSLHCGGRWKSSNNPRRFIEGKLARGSRYIGHRTSVSPHTSTIITRYPHSVVSCWIGVKSSKKL